VENAVYKLDCFIAEAKVEQKITPADVSRLAEAVDLAIRNKCQNTAVFLIDKICATLESVRKTLEDSPIVEVWRMGHGHIDRDFPPSTSGSSCESHRRHRITRNSSDLNYSQMASEISHVVADWILRPSSQFVELRTLK